MRPLLLLREALATTWSAKVPSALVALLVAVMCAGTLATVGRTAAAEAQLTARLDSAGSRVLIASDALGAELISPTIVDQVRHLDLTERAVGTLIPVDVVTGQVGAGGTKVPAWGVVGDLTEVAKLTAGRWPGPGEALVSASGQDQLRLDQPVGWVRPAATGATEDYTVVGSFTPRAPFEAYGAGVLYVPHRDGPVDNLHVVISRADLAQTAQGMVLALIAPPTPEAIRVVSPVSLAELQAQVTGDLTTFGRTLLLGVLGAGGLLVGIVTLADVLVRRKDLGRRRALGATRTTILLLVVLRTLLPAALGAAVGVATGLWLTARLGSTPPLAFTSGTAILALLAAVASAVLPALYAATRDPVRVLRTP